MCYIFILYVLFSGCLCVFVFICYCFVFRLFITFFFVYIFLSRDYFSRCQTDTCIHDSVFTVPVEGAYQRERACERSWGTTKCFPITFFLFHPRHTPTKLLLSLSLSHSLSLHPSLHLSICSFPPSPPGAFHTAPCRERLDSPSPCAPRSGDSRRAARWQTGRAESFCPSDFCGGFLSLPLSLFSIIIIIIISTTQGIVRLSFPGSSGNLSSHHRVPLPTSCNLSKRGAFVSATR